METKEQYNQLKMIKDLLIYIPEKHINIVLKCIHDLHKEINGLTKENEHSKEALQEISECIDGFYDNSNPKRLYPELVKFAGYISVMNKVCNDSLKE
jgi:hypothetical protein